MSLIKEPCTIYFKCTVYFKKYHLCKSCVFEAQLLIIDKTVITSTKIQTVSNKDAAPQTLCFLMDRVVHFHGPLPRLCDLYCGLELKADTNFQEKNLFVPVF